MEGINFGLANPSSWYDGAKNTNALLAGLAQKEAGQKLSEGDEVGASKTLMQSGDISSALALDDRHKTMDLDTQKRSAQASSDIADALYNVSQTEGKDKVLPAFDHLTPLFAHMGATPEEIKQYRGMVAANPDEFINTLSTGAKAHLASLQKSSDEGYTLKPGEQRFQGNQPLANVAPLPDKPVVVPEGGTLVQPPTPGATTLPQGAAPATQGVPWQTVKEIESQGNPAAVSPKGAEGTMQTMPTTLTNPGYGVAPADPKLLADPKTKADELERVGKDYYGAMQQKYGPLHGLMAYNWGPGNVDNWLAKGAKWTDVPKETREYVGNAILAGGGAAGAGGASGAPSITPGGGGPIAPGQVSGGATVLAEGQPKPGPKTPVPLSDDAVNTEANKYLTTGAMTTMGMGNSDARVQILNKAADIAKQYQMTGSDIADMQTGFKSNSAALTKMTTTRAQIGAFEGTVQQSMDLVRQYAPAALSNTGFQALNKGSNWWKRQTNDPAMAQLDNAIQTTTNEYAKVISNATGGGVTSDAARAHAEELINAADSPKSLEAKLQVLQKEMNFRVGSMDKQISGIHDKVTNALKPYQDRLKVQAAPNSAPGQPALQDLIDEARKRGLVK